MRTGLARREVEGVGGFESAWARETGIAGGKAAERGGLADGEPQGAIDVDGETRCTSRAFEEQGGAGGNMDAADSRPVGEELVEGLALEVDGIAATMRTQDRREQRIEVVAREERLERIARVARTRRAREIGQGENGDGAGRAGSRRVAGALERAREIAREERLARCHVARHADHDRARGEREMREDTLEPARAPLQTLDELRPSITASHSTTSSEPA